MEQAFYKTHEKLVVQTLRWLPHRIIRGVLEIAVLSIGVLVVFLLCSLHAAYVLVPSSSKEINFATSNKADITNCLQPLNISSFSNVFIHSDLYAIVQINIHHQPREDMKDIFVHSYNGVEGSLSYGKLCLRDNSNNGTCVMNDNGTDNHNEITTFLYSMERDLVIPSYANLMMNYHHYNSPKRALTIIEIHIPATHACIPWNRHSYHRWIMDHFIGYDTMVINWALQTFGMRGFISNTATYDVFDLDTVLLETLIQDSSKSKLRHLWDKLTLLMTILGVFFITSTIVHHILKETQNRMLGFTYLLQYHIRHDISYASLIFSHLIEICIFVFIMIAMVWLMFSLYKDQLLAILVWIFAWGSECFSVLCLRSNSSIRYYPKIYFCYFAIFHIYIFSYPMGFTYLAFASLLILVIHSSIHFFIHYEVPALVIGDVNSRVTRLTIFSPMLIDIYERERQTLQQLRDYRRNQRANTSRRADGSSPSPNDWIVEGSPARGAADWRGLFSYDGQPNYQYQSHIQPAASLQDLNSTRSRRGSRSSPSSTTTEPTRSSMLGYGYHESSDNLFLLG